MSADGALIVGGGHAGVQIAASLRESGYTAPVTIVSDERHAPYQRPPLSKAFLLGAANPSSISLRSDRFYEAKDITVRTDLRIASADVLADGSGTARGANGEVIRFDHLAIATGAANRRLSIPGADLRGVHYLRSMDDAIGLQSMLGAAEDVVIIGGGVIGLESAAVARSLGKSVTVIETQDRLLGRAVQALMGDFFLAAHRRRGTRVLLNSGVAAIEGASGTVERIVLPDGETIKADLVLVGIGVLPRIELASAIGLECDGGVVVDSACRTSHPRVVAAGDCVVAPHPISGRPVRLESVQAATSQARVAAASLIGADASYTEVPWFWSDQDTMKLQIAGLCGDSDETLLRGDPESEQFSVLHYRDGRIVGVESVNAPGDFLAVRNALTHGLSIPADRAASPATPLRELAHA